MHFHVHRAPMVGETGGTVAVSLGKKDASICFINLLIVVLGRDYSPDTCFS